MADKTTMLAFAAAAAGAAFILTTAPAAVAGGTHTTTGSCGCKKPPPPPPPPSGVNINQKLNVEVNVNNTINATSVISNVIQNSATNTVSNSISNVQTNISNNGLGEAVTGGGGAAGFVSPGSVSVANIAVGGGEENEAYEATRTKFEKVVIQAFCFDDKDVPHPASQVSPDREIEGSYEGEIYRCIAGTHMQVTIAPWRENVSFEGGQTLTCAKGEALYHWAGPNGGHIACRAQIPARDCNERSLLRRFGAGVKIMTIEITEKYTAYRERSTQGGATAMSFDGGVGGVMN